MVSFDPDSNDVCNAATDAYIPLGIEYCPLHCLCGGAGASLQSLDRFFALADASPGPVAVQWRRGHLPGAASSPGIHNAALLLRRRSFATAAQALAWIRMARPDVPAGPADLLLLDSLSPVSAGSDGPRGLLLPRTLSASARLPAPEIPDALTSTKPVPRVPAAGPGRSYSSPGTLCG